MRQETDADLRQRRGRFVRRTTIVYPARSTVASITRIATLRPARRTVLAAIALLRTTRAIISTTRSARPGIAVALRSAPAAFQRLIGLAFEVRVLVCARGFV